MNHSAIHIPDSLQFVIKITKFCNIRCQYCYEHAFLDNPAKISLEHFQTFFSHIVDYCSQTPNIKYIELIWHGGEPLSIKPDYYRQIQAIQASIFQTTDLIVINKVQTNLTILHENYLQALQAGLFDGIGVSIDIVGNCRVDKQAQAIEPKVLQNMQILKNNEITFGSICVLSKKNHLYIEQIFNFFDQNAISFRILPIYLTQHMLNADQFSLSAGSIVHAYKQVFEAWLKSENATNVEPLNSYINSAINYLNQIEDKHYYKKAISDALFIIDTNGDVYSTDEIYTEDTCYGNIFTQSLIEITRSANYLKATQRAEQKMQATCYQCQYFGYCMGFEMAEATQEQLVYDQHSQLTCAIVKPILDYMVDRLRQLKLV
jgi:uncharacterized protein